MTNRKKPRFYFTVGLLLLALALILFGYAIIYNTTFHSTLLKLLYFFGGLFTIGAILLIVLHKKLNFPTKAEAALAISSILFTCLLLEGMARLFLNYLATPEQYNQYVLYTDVDPTNLQWSNHHYLNYFPTPNYVSNDGLTTHNSLGFRSQEFKIDKPIGTYRIVALGGSTTYTTRVSDNNKTFTAQLEHILRNNYNFEQVEVINAGVASYNSWESLINLAFRVIDLDPDLIIIYHGTNDVHTRFVTPDSYVGDNSGSRKQWSNPPISIFDHSVLSRIIRRRLGFSRQASLSDFIQSEENFWGTPYLLKQSPFSPDEMLDANPPIYFERNLVSMIGMAQAHDIEVLLTTWAYIPILGDDYTSTAHYQRGFAEGNEIVQRVAAAHDTLLFDFAAVMPQDESYWSDGVHVNEAGAALKAELFAEFISQSILIPNP